tara:strand:- start:1087 stop:1470 length:384 start_codon:yes stop_codon:yes gene_type:complete
MREFTAVVSHSGGKITKYQDFDSKTDAENHVATYGGKIVQDLDNQLAYWDVSGDTPSKDTDQLAADILAGKWAAIRTQRDKLMAQSDWMAMPDSPAMSDPWTAYRTALRNLPASQADPDDIVWPTAP